MPVRHLTFAASATLALLLSGCGDSSKLPEQAKHRPAAANSRADQIADPDRQHRRRRPDGAPTASRPPPAGSPSTAFAHGLDHPRWVYVLPNGDVLVAESNEPKKARTRQGIKGWIMDLVQQSYAGAGVESANRITLLRDRDGDGVAETATAFLNDLNSPFGMALIGDTFYVANTDAVVRFKYQEGATADHRAPGEKLADLPGGPLNHHWTKNIIASKDGTKLYATVGSNSNRRGERARGRARCAPPFSKSISPPASKRIFAAGLRNPNGMGLRADDRRIVDRRQRARRTRQRSGAGLPDLGERRAASTAGRSATGASMSMTRVKPRTPDLVAKAIKPDYALGNHVAPLGMTFAQTSEGNTSSAAAGFRRAAPSSASTARGTASRAAATRWCSCRSPTASRRPICRSTC